jgi:hypothetical protein
VLTWACGGVGRRRSVAVVALLVGYVAVVGPSPAVVRATAMVAAALVGRAFGVGGAGWGSHLSLAAAASLLVRPGWLGDLGFQLSYLSVLGMGLAAAPLAVPRRRWRRAFGPAAGAAAALPSPGSGAWRGVRGAAVGVTAQWATGSLVASHFGAMPVVAPLANLVAVPLASALVPLGFAAGVARAAARRRGGCAQPGDGPGGGGAAPARRSGGARARPPLGRGGGGRARGVRASGRSPWRPGCGVSGDPGGRDGRVRRRLVTVVVPPLWGRPT